nr:unnamed protein product [Callosobruchus analis]
MYLIQTIGTLIFSEFLFAELIWGLTLQ